MDRSSEAAARIQQIEDQQDELLRQLEELERRTESALAEHAPPRPAINATTDLAAASATAVDAPRRLILLDSPGEAASLTPGGASSKL